MTWDIKRVFPYYKRTQVLKDLKTPTPRKTDTSPETTHCRPDSCDVPRHMSAYVAGFFGFLGWVFRVICPFWVWGVSGHLSVFWLVGFVGVYGVFGDDFPGVFVDDYGVCSVY